MKYRAKNEIIEKMNSSRWSIIILFVVVLAAWGQQKADNKGDLVVIISGLENNEGQMMIALNNSEEDYNAKREAFRGVQARIREQRVSWKFTEIPHGEYAIKVYHDEDGDGELDTNFLGIPSEDYGFSNNARGSFGPASWDDAKFLFHLEIDTMEIKVE
jgi:uncharacterized protein (DUF2141 family)